MNLFDKGYKIVKVLFSSNKLTKEPLQDGEIIEYEGTELEKGLVVYIEDAAGNLSVCGDGDWITKANVHFTITGGIVTDIDDSAEKNNPKPDLPIKQAQAKEPYGNVEYGDPGYQPDKQKRYPLDTEAHIKNAWSRINQEQDSSQYSPADLKKVKDNILAAYRSKIDPAGPPSLQKNSNLMKPITRPTTKLSEEVNEELADAPDATDADASSDASSSDSDTLQAILKQLQDLNAALGVTSSMAKESKEALSKITPIVEKLSKAPGAAPIEKVTTPFVKQTDDNKEDILTESGMAKSFLENMSFSQRRKELQKFSKNIRNI